MTGKPLYCGDGKQRPEAARDLPDVDPEALRRDAQGLAHLPSLAELLNWLDALVPETGRGTPPGGVADLDQADLLAKTRGLLFKNQPDQAQAAVLIARWRESRAPGRGNQVR